MNGIRSSKGLPGTALVFFALHALGSAGAASAATIPVTNCHDKGIGSLRNAVRLAIDGDTIDMRPLQCRKILLTSGAIVVPQANLNLLGRDPLALTIDGDQRGRVIRHTGTGTLRVTSLSVANGRTVAYEASGGCINSDGNLELRWTRLHHCYAGNLDGYPNASWGLGGGAFARGNVRLFHANVFANKTDELGEGYGGDRILGGGGVYAQGNAVVSHSHIFSNSTYDEGGGIASVGHMTIYRSRINGNSAAPNGEGGGVSVNGGLNVQSSLIDHNYTNNDGGGIRALNGDVTINQSALIGNRAEGEGGGVTHDSYGDLRIINSTISGNIGRQMSAAVGQITMFNSTVAFNEEKSTGPVYLPCVGAIISGELDVDSSIIASNTCSTGPSIDIGNYGLSGFTVIGSHNLIGSSLVALPADTLRGDPRLAPLADNGGGTPTHALLSASPAIGKGSNLLDLLYDQRGPGFPRVNGDRADIGAFER